MTLYEVGGKQALSHNDCVVSQGQPSPIITVEGDRPPRATQRPGGSLTITHAPAKRRGRAAGVDANTAAGPVIDREHANCLSCGKIYHCHDTTPATRAFLGAGLAPRADGDGGVLSLHISQWACLLHYHLVATRLACPCYIPARRNGESNV